MLVCVRVSVFVCVCLCVCVVFVLVTRERKRDALILLVHVLKLFLQGTFMINRKLLTFFFIDHCTHRCLFSITLAFHLF